MASLFTKPAEAWTLEDVERLISDAIEEGQRLDYKSELHLGTKPQRREVARDAGGMANAVGGLLVYGMLEKELADGRVVPDKLTPLSDHSLRDRLENILDSTVSPRLNVQTQPIDVEGGYVLVLRVRERAGALHMVEGYDDHRYFIRRGRRVTPMTEREVTDAFASVASGELALDALLMNTPLLPRIAANRARVLDVGFDPESLSPWLSVVAAPLNSQRQPFIVIQTAVQNAFRHLPDTPRLGRGDVLGVQGYEIDQYGYLQEFPDEDRHPPYKWRMRLYRNGVLEWGARLAPMRDAMAIPSQTVVELVHDVLAYFGTVYQRIGYFGPVATYLGLDNAENTRLAVGDGVIQPLSVRVLEGEVDLHARSPDVTPDELAQGPTDIVQRGMDYLWQTYGWPRCQLFDEDGKYDPGRSW
jgi:hypothetical protein